MNQSIDINLEELVDEALQRVESLIKDRRSDEAEIIAAQILKVAPTSLNAMQLYGLVLYSLGKYTAAIDVINQAIELDNTNSENYNNISLCYLQTNQLEKALESQTKATQLKPNNVNYLNNLAIIYRSTHNLEESIKTFEKSCELDPANVKTLESFGSTYGQLKQMDKVIEKYNKVLELEPDHSGACVELAYAYHLLGEWEKAWPYYERRLEYWHKTNKAASAFYNSFDQTKAWNGKDSLKNKKIVVYCEQGIGDYINFIRFVPRLKELGADVHIEAPECLVSLFSNFGNVTNQKVKDYDYHCSVLSLPYFLNLSEKDCLGSEPYINVTEKFEFPSLLKDIFKIGIQWAGNPAHPNDALRSFHLNNFKNISKIPNVQLFSLQKDTRKRVYANLPDVCVDLSADCEDMYVIDMADQLGDFLNTAKIINGLDLIITADTSTLHLAGAMGKETWTLIPYNPDWRWKLEGEKTVWYDSVTLFRQKEYNNWHHPFAEMQKLLEERVK